MPLVNAAEALLSFYNNILLQTLNPWANEEPQLALTISMGHLELTMAVVPDSSRNFQGIPWSFVRTFARDMVIMTCAGFTGTFVMQFSTDRGYNAIPDLTVEVRLRILWHP